MHLAISGKLASGKSTAARLFFRELVKHGHHVAITRFSARLYTLCAAYDGAQVWTGDSWTPRYHPTAQQALGVSQAFVKELSGLALLPDPSPDLVIDLTQLALETPTGQSKNRSRLRAIAQRVRQTDPLIWIKFLALELRSAQAANRFFIISDLRMPTEAQRCQQEGIACLRIDISPQTQRRRLQARQEPYDPQACLHPTETALDTWPHFQATYANEGSPDDLATFVRSYVRLHHEAFSISSQNLEDTMPSDERYLSQRAVKAAEEVFGSPLHSEQGSDSPENGSTRRKAAERKAAEEAFGSLIVPPDPETSTPDISPPGYTRFEI